MLHAPVRTNAIVMFRSFDTSAVHLRHMEQGRWQAESRGEGKVMWALLCSQSPRPSPLHSSSKFASIFVPTQKRMSGLQKAT